MKSTFSTAILIFFAMIMAGITSCKKEKNKDPDKNDAYAPVDVLNSNGQFEHIWDTTAFAQTFGTFGMSDMTIQDGHLLNFAFIDKLSGGSYTGNVRGSLDLNTKKLVPLPDGAETTNLPRFVNAGSGRQTMYINEFRPYTNEFITLIGVNNYSNDHTIVWFYGDVDYDGFGVNGNGRITNTYSNYFDLGYRHISAYSWYNEVFSFLGLNPNPQPFLLTKLDLTHNAFGDVGPYSFSNGDQAIRPLYCEAVRGTSTMFATTEDNKLIVAEYQPSLFEQGAPVTITPTTFITAVSYTPYYPTYTGVSKTYRHYSEDGNQMGLFVYHEDVKKYYSFTYNFQTKTLKKALDGVSLDYGDNDLSDIAFDEEGNMYYTGYANNGSNKEGVSIYKIAPTGTNLVGNDNFLKFGEVVKLKYLLGKIYLAVQGRKTGTQVQQLSILRQK